MAALLIELHRKRQMHLAFSRLAAFWHSIESFISNNTKFFDW